MITIVTRVTLGKAQIFNTTDLVHELNTPIDYNICGHGVLMCVCERERERDSMAERNKKNQHPTTVVVIVHHHNSITVPRNSISAHRMASANPIRDRGQCASQHYSCHKITQQGRIVTRTTFSSNPVSC